MKTSDIIRELCKEHGISVTSLEKELGFGNGSLTKNASIKSDRLYSVAKYFNVSMEYLMDGNEAEKESSSGKKYYFSDETAEMAQKLFDDPDTRMLFDAARDSSPEDLRMAADLLKRFKETNPDG